MSTLMTHTVASSTAPDEPVIAKQLGRPPGAAAVTVSRCASGYPVVIRNAGVTATGRPFPTLYWLTCPELALKISRLEAEGFISVLRGAIEEDEPVRARLLESNSSYIATRDKSALTGGGPGTTGGIGGASDVFKVKCLHAHAADWLAAGLNPIGERVLANAPITKGCARCSAL